ncbi:3'-5' DNA helicase [Xylographa carneopallida]|nr:3'-5' DNA helicase [Xylographa carneopallida]
MADSDADEFGDAAVEELMLLATQVEQQNINLTTSLTDKPSYRPSKRRRLSGPDQGGILSTRHRNESACTSEGVEGLSDHDSHDDHNTIPSTIPSEACPSQDSERTNESPKEKPSSRHKIHIPKYTDLPETTFYTQVPPSSQSPYRIRGCYWQKPKPPAAPSSVTCRNDGRQAQEITRDSAKEVIFPISGDGHISLSMSKTAPVKARTPSSNKEYGFHDQSVIGKELLADAAIARELQSREAQLLDVDSYHLDSQQWQSQAATQPRLVGLQKNLRQTTLFGAQVLQEEPQTQSVRRLNWPLANRAEPLTHHILKTDALQSWVYPTNLGTIRDYQYSIVARGLYHNLLVALPTGLGKTFIAATIMLNWFRWTRDAQIVFVAPTRPLVSQQVEACFNIAGIPRSATTLLTGNTSPGIRAEEWQTKRVFFMTPQTIVNDLKSGIADPKKIVLLVVDEAHRATGSYAYVEVVQFLRRFNTSFRVLALTATPGASVEAVQEVIDGLGISRVEIRTEESLDIRQYVHPRKIDSVIFEYSDEITMAMDLFAKALQPLLNKLIGMNAYWNRDPMNLTPYGCTTARQQWMASDAGRKAHMGVKGMVNTIFSILASLAHAVELLKFHGIGPFYHKLVDFRSEVASGEKGSKYKKEINESEHFNKLMTRVGTWIGDKDFIGHPKLEHLRSVVLNHFLDAGDGKSVIAGVSPANTRIMVFAHYRDSAEEIARVLRRDEPMIRPHVFVGQAHSKGSEGMDQKKQLDIIAKFKRGEYNTLVATSIGEEGLDIGEVDLIVCYDASASPIRMLQRMGRTGRKRAGNIVMLLMKGKEEDNFTKAKDNYAKMQEMIEAGTRFTYHEDLSPRIVPRDVHPVVEKKIIEIPLENTQSDLPEPKKRRKPPKRPPKKFHMPDGVRQGFTKASRIDDDDNDDENVNDSIHERKSLANHRSQTHVLEIDPVPNLESVLLTANQQRDLERNYLDVGGEAKQVVTAPRLDAFPSLQRVLRPFKYVRHGRKTERMVRMLSRLHCITEDPSERFTKSLNTDDLCAGHAQFSRRDAFLSNRAQNRIESTNYTPIPSPPLLQQAGNIRSDLRGTPLGSSQSVAGINLMTSGGDTANGEVDNGSDLADFIDDEDLLGNDDAASSASSPPASVSQEKPFYIPRETTYAGDVNLSQDLPDFTVLVASNKTSNARAPGAIDQADESSQPTRRKGKRMVVQSDSEE